MHLTSKMLNCNTIAHVTVLNSKLQFINFARRKCVSIDLEYWELLGDINIMVLPNLLQSVY